MSRTSTNSIAQLAAAAAACAMGFVVLRYVIQVPEEDALREFLVLTGIIVVSTAVVFGVVIPRALAGSGSGATALTLSLLGLLLAAAYWSGLPPVLAIGGIVLALRTKDSAPRGRTRAAVAIGAFALVANLALLAVEAA